MPFKISLDIPEDRIAEVKEKLGLSIEDSLGESCKKTIKAILLKTLKRMNESTLEPQQRIILQECVMNSFDTETIQALIKDVEESQHSLSL